MKNTLKLISLLAASAIPAINLLGGVFVITDDACPVAKGDSEFHLNWESSIATNHGRSICSSPGIEFAYGATETLEVGITLDFGHDYVNNKYARKTGTSSLKHFNYTGISLGLKNQILSPETEENPFGLALVGGFSWGWADSAQHGTCDIAFEFGLNFQKNFYDGDLVFAFTPGVAFTSTEDDDGSTFNTTDYTLAAGTSYRVYGGFRIGAECIYVLAYNEDGFDQDQFYAGPNCCYETEKWWITVAVAPRLFTTADDLTVAAQFGYVF